jgi:hypothetical protein
MKTRPVMTIGSDESGGNPPVHWSSAPVYSLREMTRSTVGPAKSFDPEFIKSDRLIGLDIPESPSYKPRTSRRQARKPG